MQKLMISLLVACLVNIISVTGSPLIFKTVNANFVHNERLIKNNTFVDDKNTDGDEEKELRKSKIRYKRQYRKDKKMARIQARQYKAGDRLYSNHRDRTETRSIGGF
jgi:hypothetical protein